VQEVNAWACLEAFVASRHLMHGYEAMCGLCSHLGWGVLAWPGGVAGAEHRAACPGQCGFQDADVGLKGG
jgi:hypothetical protein